MKKRNAKFTGTPPRQDIQTSFFRLNENTFAGYAVDPEDFSRRYTIDLMVDGCIIATAWANDPVQELVARGIGDGCYGFTISLANNVIRDGNVVEASVSNLGIKLGEPIALVDGTGTVSGIEGPRRLSWLGGLRFSGWVDQSHPVSQPIDIAVDGQLVARVSALKWTQIGDDEVGGRAVRAFDLHLPMRFGDGCVHRISIAGESGSPLENDAIPFVAFADGLADTIAKLGRVESERLRGELFDRLLPMSVPFEHYERWRERFPFPIAAPTTLKAAVVLVGAGNERRTLDSLEQQNHDEWIAASLGLDGQQTCFDSEEARIFLEEEGKSCDFIVFALSGTVLEPDALARIGNAFDQFEGSELVYCDINIEARDGNRWPLAFPAFDYERMLEQGYCAHLFGIRRNSALKALAQGASSLYRLFNSVFDDDHSDPSKIVVHIPGAAATIPGIDIAAAAAALGAASSEHLKRRQLSVEVSMGNGEILPAVRIGRPTAPGKTTIIIPTRNRHALVRRCLDTIAPAVDRVSADILIVDNDSSDPETMEYLAEIDGDNIRVLRIEGAFNFSRLNNRAAAAVTSEYLCLLNNDIEAMDDEWLEEMLGRIAAPDVGAVGALLERPSGVIRHGGVVLGPHFDAAHAFNDRLVGDPGYSSLLRVAHECSAVTAACLLTRRSDYLGVGGMDEVRFGVAYNDVDFCLKLRQAGKRIVMTPHASLRHLESASRGRDRTRDSSARFEREREMFRARWAEALANDGFYNPTLSLSGNPYSALAWPPRNMAGRVNHPAAPTIVPACI